MSQNAAIFRLIKMTLQENNLDMRITVQDYWKILKSRTEQKQILNLRGLILAPKEQNKALARF